jgi:uncharacterized membrane protein YfcA
VPMLVYVAGVPVKEAVGLSLAIVGATSAVGAVFKARQGEVDGRAATLFGVTGMLGSALGARLTRLVPATLLLMLFALLMVVVGLRMLQSQREAEEPKQAECSPRKCGLAGLGVGVLTGFLGVGGGFLIVPALLRWARMPMRRAVGTSLVIIAANAAAGFMAHASEMSAGLDLAAAFTAMAVVGVWAGTAVSGRMHPARLRMAFGGLALTVAAYLMVMNVGALLGLVAH